MFINDLSTASFAICVYCIFHAVCSDRDPCEPYRMYTDALGGVNQKAYQKSYESVSAIALRGDMPAGTCIE